jgi:hypothetical protein
MRDLKYAYKSGKNPWGDNANYHCHYCDLELFGEEVGFVAYGRECANGEFSPCPRCGKENGVNRDDERD